MTETQLFKEGFIIYESENMSREYLEQLDFDEITALCSIACPDVKGKAKIKKLWYHTGMWFVKFEKVTE